MIKVTILKATRVINNAIEMDGLDVKYEIEGKKLGMGFVSYEEALTLDEQGIPSYLKILVEAYNKMKEQSNPIETQEIKEELMSMEGEYEI